MVVALWATYQSSYPFTLFDDCDTRSFHIRVEIPEWVGMHG